MEDVVPQEVRGWRRRLLLPLAHFYFALARGMTLGVRAACFDSEGRIFLVRHSYLPGWYLPGGGVERHETVDQALAKELREEGNLAIAGVPQLVGLYLNRADSRRDHVAFYRVAVEQTTPRESNWEIVESGFFSLDALPATTTQATLRRLQELKGEIAPSGFW
jgi:ADP-ribose pyrophosphatase YjhB (NUDIX family)